MNNIDIVDIEDEKGENVDVKSIKVSDEESSYTFLDDVYSQISKENEDAAGLLSDIIKRNGYDTESLYQDVKIYKNNGISNISIQYNDKNLNGDDDDNGFVMSKLMEIMDKTKS